MAQWQSACGAGLIPDFTEQCSDFDFPKFIETGCDVHGGLMAAPQAAQGLYMLEATVA